MARGAVTRGLAILVARGDYVVEADEVAEAMLRRGHPSGMLESAQSHGLGSVCPAEDELTRGGAPDAA
jgi:hypothetical protein